MKWRCNSVIYAGVAQMVEHRISNPGYIDDTFELSAVGIVSRSNDIQTVQVQILPLAPYVPLAQAGRATAF